jgi:ATP-dependent RNA helicase SUPV3L1/SUV3
MDTADLNPPSHLLTAETDETSGFDVLVASDAVGLGLNLNIARVILTTTEKFDGAVDRRLDPSEIKQVGDRGKRGVDGWMAQSCT